LGKSTVENYINFIKQKIHPEERPKGEDTNLSAL
jgi:hypothetical protein